MSNPYESLPPVPEGYLPPADAYATGRPNDLPDPLVTSGQGISGWFQSITSTLKLSWSLQLMIFALTHLLPAVVMAILAIGGLVGFGALTPGNLGEGAIAGLFGFIVVYVLVVLLAQVLGYSSATYATTVKAAGGMVTLGQALTYGIKRMLGLTGWLFLAGLVVAGPILLIALCMSSAGPIGILMVLLMLPVMAYLLMATAMVGPVYMFERSRPIGRSFNLFHGSFGPMLGRYLLIFVSMIAYGVLEGVMNLAAEVVGMVAATVVVSIVAAVLQLPFTMVQFTAILVTYAERRADEGQITSADLAAELEGSAQGQQLALGQ